MSRAPAPSRRRAGRPTAASGSPVNDGDMLAAALVKFSTIGYDGVSVRTLNRELGVSHNLIHQRYGSKEGLYFAAVDYAFSEIFKHAGDVREPFDGETDMEFLRRFIVSACRANAARPEVLRLVSTEGATESSRLSHIFSTFIEPRLGGVASCILRLQNDGTFRPFPLRVFYFLLLHGATALAGCGPLAARVDRNDPLLSDPEAPDAEVIADILLAGLAAPGKDRRAGRSPAPS